MIHSAVLMTEAVMTGQPGFFDISELYEALSAAGDPLERLRSWWTLRFSVGLYFKLRIYNSTLSLMYCCTFPASAAGADGVNLSLKLTDSFSPFMYIVSGTIAIGSLLFLMLPKRTNFEKIG